MAIFKHFGFWEWTAVAVATVMTLAPLVPYAT